MGARVGITLQRLLLQTIPSSKQRLRTHLLLLQEWSSGQFPAISSPQLDPQTRTGVEVGRGVEVGVLVAVGAMVEVGLGVLVGVGVGVGARVPVGVGVGVCVVVGVWVGAPVGVTVGVGVSVLVGPGVPVLVGVGEGTVNSTVHCGLVAFGWSGAWNSFLV